MDYVDQPSLSGAIEWTPESAYYYHYANGCGKISGEYFSLAAGTDLAPLLQGLEGDLCHSPHRGYLLEGEVTVTYADGAQETVKRGPPVSG